MDFTAQYQPALWGVFLILVTWQLQWLVATGARSALPNPIPGKFDDTLGHSSFAFRAHRTFINSLENLPLMLGSCLLAFLAGASPLWTSVCIWLFAIARLGHMALYYAIATEKNPSPRSYFFLLGLAANVALLIVCALALLAPA